MSLRLGLVLWWVVGAAGFGRGCCGGAFAICIIYILSPNDALLFYRGHALIVALQPALLLQDPDTASDLPLRSSVVQRLQRFATYGHLKQLVLRMIADELGTAPTSQLEAQVGRRGVWVGKRGACMRQKPMKALQGLLDELDVDKSNWQPQISHNFQHFP